MIIRFWGTRGSLPVAANASTIRRKVANALVAANGRRFADAGEALAYVEQDLDFAVGATYGGATACVEIDGGDGAFVICDMGSGLREFGLDALKRCAAGHPRIYHFFLSHLHWDHIMGFPFFAPAFDPEARIVIHAGHAEAEQALRRQQEEISFPVPFDWLKARIEFVPIEPGVEINVSGLRVRAMAQHHSHGSFGYRFNDAAGKTVIFSTDSEHKIDLMKGESSFIDFFRDADLVISDTMYSLAESVSMKEDWGHSSNIVAIDLCHEAAAKRLALFHHEPTYDDEAIARMHQESIRYEALTREQSPLDVLCAYDGLELQL